MKKFLICFMVLVGFSWVAEANVIHTWGPTARFNATVEATKGVLYADGSIATTAIGTTAATELSTTTLTVDHIGEKTSSHKIVFDNNLNAAGRTWTDLGTVTTAIITAQTGTSQSLTGYSTAGAYATAGRVNAGSVVVSGYLTSESIAGTNVIATALTRGTVSDTEFGYLDGVTSAIQTQLTARLPLAGGTMTGDAVFITGESVQIRGDDNKVYMIKVIGGVISAETI